MKLNKQIKTSMALAAVTALALAGSVQAAIIVVDDFTSDTLSTEWEQTRALTVGATWTNTYNTTTTADQLTAATGAGTGAATQDVLLRDDFSLAVGDTLFTDIVTADSRDVTGLMISNTKNPTAETRTNSLIMGFGSTGLMAAVAFDNPGGFTNVTGAATGTVAQFFIRRSATDEFEMGYVNTLSNEFIVRTVDTSTDYGAGMGSAVGYWVDLKPGDATVFDNLTIDAVPEPSSTALLGLGGLALILRRRR